MSDEIVKRVLETVKAVSQDRHKLVILLGVFGSGKTKILKQIEAESDAVYVNLNLELSERFLQMPASKVGDGITAPALIDDICDQFSQGGKTLLIDNVELLFSPELSKINPVDTFKRMSRERPVVLALPAVRQGIMPFTALPIVRIIFPSRSKISLSSKLKRNNQHGTYSRICFILKKLKKSSKLAKMKRPKKTLKITSSPKAFEITCPICSRLWLGLPTNHSISWGITAPGKAISLLLWQPFWSILITVY